MAPGDGSLPAGHFTTQLDGPSETLLSARTHIDRKAVKGIGFMEEEQNHAAKGQMVALMQAGHSWQEASTMAGVQISRSAAYRLLQKVRTQGEAGLHDGRHGHPAKLREPVQQWLKDYCQAAPGTPSHIVQQALQNRFGVLVSISHLNATRAALGLGSRTTPLRGKNWRRTQASNPSG
jgi:transposase